MNPKQRHTPLIFVYLIIFLLVPIFSPGCIDLPAAPTLSPSPPSATHPPAVIPPSSTAITPTTLPTQTRTPGPSPTSTPLPPLKVNTWQAGPFMIEAAYIGTDMTDPFPYTPFFLLYGDGYLVKRSCQNGECRYLETQLNQGELCRLVNAVDRTGFLHANPLSVFVPGGTGSEVRLAVQVYEDNSVQVPDLERWVESSDWFSEVAGCPNCYEDPEIDPAFISLYRLLTTYDESEMSGLQTDRLALWLTKPIISGNPQTWNDELISLVDLDERSTCLNEPAQRQAVILEGSMAHAAAGFLSVHGGGMPIFIENEIVWQVHSRWLLPDEMPKTCDRPAGLYPHDPDPEIIWVCEPEMGAIPTATATITLTPTQTRTPLR